MQESLKLFVQLIRPSVLSLMVGFASGIALLGTAAYYYVYKGSQIEYYNSLAWDSQGGVSQKIDQLTSYINSSNIAGTASIFVTWALLGIIGFGLILAVHHVITGSASFVGTLRFLPPNKRSGFVLEVGEHLLLRLTGGLLLYGTYLMAVYIAPYLLLILDNLRDNPSLPMLIISVGLITAAAIVVVHLTAVSLRLLLVRSRVFL